MIVFALFYIVFGDLVCKERCCQDVCNIVCDDDKADFGCSMAESVLQSSAGYLCMKEFLVMETEVRLLFYYYKYYSFSILFSQLKVVLKQLPLFHAECYLYMNGIQY